MHGQCRLCNSNVVHTKFYKQRLLYHFELFSVSRVTGPLDGAEIGDSHGSHWPWPAVTKYSLRTQAWAYPAENLVRRKLARITRHTGLCRSKISAQWSRVTGHAEQFEMVQYCPDCPDFTSWFNTALRKSTDSSIEIHRALPIILARYADTSKCGCHIFMLAYKYSKY